MFGKSQEEKQLQAQREESEKQRKQALHQSNLQGEAPGDTTEFLSQISEIDDLPDFEGESLSQFASKVVSTANLSSEDVESDEWVREYILTLWRAQFPPEYGLKGMARAYALDDKTAKKDPLDVDAETEAEMFKHTTGLALTRSEDMAVVKEAGRAISESRVEEVGEDDSSGGILGYLRG